MQPLKVSESNPRMVIDWSVLCYIAWFKMKTPGYMARTRLEIDEFAMNLAEYMLYLVKRFTPSELVLAVDDDKNWRAPYYDSYYATHVDFYRVRSESHGWIVTFDKVFYHATMNDATEKWFYDKLSKKDSESLMLGDLATYTPFIGGKASDWLTINYPEAPKTVWEHPDADGLRRIVPKYKGTRASSTWSFETPKDEWKILCRNIAGHIAPVMGGRAIRVDYAEGDDIVAAFCLAETVVPTILVSIDSDLRQLCIPCLGLSIFDPKKSRFTQPTREGAMWELACKMLGGDTSDNIFGASLKGSLPFSSVDWNEDGSVKGGKKTVAFVRDLLEKAGNNFPGMYKELNTALDPDSWERNQNLVHLGRIPASLMATLREAVAWREAPTAKYSLIDFGITEASALSITNQATIDRNAQAAAA